MRVSVLHVVTGEKHYYLALGYRMLGNSRESKKYFEMFICQ